MSTTLSENVSQRGVLNRGCTSPRLTLTALTIKETLDIGGREINYRTFSIIPFRIFKKFICQRDMPELYRKFSAISPYDNSLISRPGDAFDRERDELESIIEKAESLAKQFLRSTNHK